MFKKRDIYTISVIVLLILAWVAWFLYKTQQNLTEDAQKITQLQAVEISPAQLAEFEAQKTNRRVATLPYENEWKEFYDRQGFGWSMEGILKAYTFSDYEFSYWNLRRNKRLLELFVYQAITLSNTSLDGKIYVFKEGGDITHLYIVYSDYSLSEIKLDEKGEPITVMYVDDEARDRAENEE